MCIVVTPRVKRCTVVTLCVELVLWTTDIAVADTTFEADGISLTISSDGAVVALLDTVAGLDRIRLENSLCTVKTGGTTYEPIGFLIHHNRLLSFFFDSEEAGLSEVSILIEELPRYLRITLENVEPPSADIDHICFADLYLCDAIRQEADCLLFFDDDSDEQDDRIFGVYPLNVFTQVSGGSASGGYLEGCAYPDLPHPTINSLIGEQVAVFTCDADQSSLFDITGEIENDNGIPWGVVSKERTELRESCFFYADSATMFDPNAALRYAVDAGVGRILLFHKLLGDHKRSYIAENGLWGSSAELHDWVAQCQSVGFVVGVHFFPSKIFRNSIDYIHAGCDPRIHRDSTQFLAEDLPASQTEGLIRTTTSPPGEAIDPANHDIVIGLEIIEYTDVQLIPGAYGYLGPFVRAKNQTGEGGLGPQDHLAGESVQHLAVASSSSYQWSIVNSGVKDWCHTLAQRLFRAGMDYAYLDCVTGTQLPLWYSVPYQMITLHEQFGLYKPLLWVESGDTLDGFCYPLVAISGQMDYWGHAHGDPNHSFKEEVDTNIAVTFAQVPGYCPRQLGWAPLNYSFIKSDFQATPDDLEYILAKSVAHDVPTVFQIWTSHMDEWPNRDANLYLISRYEQLRLDGYFPVLVRIAAQKPGQDFMLFDTDPGNSHLVQTSLLNIADSSEDVRGFITDKALGGDRYVTLWPTAAEADLIIVLELEPENIVIRDYRGDIMILCCGEPGEIEIPLSERLYLQLFNVPDPLTTFEQAFVYPADELRRYLLESGSDSCPEDP